MKRAGIEQEENDEVKEVQNEDGTYSVSFKLSADMLDDSPRETKKMNKDGSYSIVYDNMEGW